MDERVGPVLVINSNPDVATIVRVALELDGFRVVSSVSHRDLNLLVAVDDLRCVVYDATPPWEEQWAFLATVRSMDELQQVPFVLTSTDPERVATWCVAAGASDWQLVGKPYDLPHVVAAVRRALGVVR